MVTLLLVTAGIAAFEIAAVKFGSDSRVDTHDAAPGTPMGTDSPRWL